MGGYGSGGRRHGKARALAGNCLTLSAADFRRAGVFEQAGALGGKGKFGPLELGLSIPADRREIKLEIERKGDRSVQTIRLSQTAPHFGGTRFWIHCPLCKRRVEKLFFYPHLYNGEHPLTVFWCGLCLGLSYASRNCNHDWLTLGQRRAGRIKRKLGDTNEYWGTPPRKPKWMRRVTYARHMEKFRAAVELADAGFVASAAQRFPQLFKDLGAPVEG